MLLAWAVLVCLTPTSAEASCGDYVMVTGNGSHHQDQGRSIGDSGTMAAHSHTMTSQSGRPAVPPCRGPHCSRRNSVPPLAPTTPLRLNVEQWAVLISDVPASSSDEIVLPVTDPSMGFATSLVSRIYRPPR